MLWPCLGHRQRPSGALHLGVRRGLLPRTIQAADRELVRRRVRRCGSSKLGPSLCRRILRRRTTNIRGWGVWIGLGPGWALGPVMGCRRNREPFSARSGSKAHLLPGRLSQLSVRCDRYEPRASATFCCIGSVGIAVPWWHRRGVGMAGERRSRFWWSDVCRSCDSRHMRAAPHQRPRS